MIDYEDLIILVKRMQEDLTELQWQLHVLLDAEKEEQQKGQVELIQ